MKNLHRDPFASHTGLTGSYGRNTIRDRTGAVAEIAKREQLRSRTVEAFDAYIREAETEMERGLYGSRPFLWSDSNPERGQQVRSRKVVAQFWSGRGPIKVPHG